MKELELLIHYGSKKFNRRRFKPIENDNWVKPKGGLWTSPANSNWSWRHWCEAEQFRDCDENNSFVVTLSDDANIFVIDSLNDLKSSPLIKSAYKNYLDFEKIADKFDAIWLTEIGQRETHLSHPIDLYGWDCESVLILNAKCVVELAKSEV